MVILGLGLDSFRVIYCQQARTKTSMLPYLGEIPWENTVIVFRDTNFHVCPVAWCKHGKELQLQNKTLSDVHAVICSEMYIYIYLTLQSHERKRSYCDSDDEH